MEIVKRSGEVVLFDSEKILNAIQKALTSSQESTDVLTHSQNVCQDVLSGLENKTYTVEEIQDKVETSLMDNHLYKTAKCYILYRDEHNKNREQNRITKELQVLADNCSEYFNHDPLREFVFSRTYAKWIPQKERRELWTETVERYINFIRSKCGDKLHPDIYTRIQKALLNMEVMPSMRLLQFAGAAADRCNVCVYNCSFSAPESFKDLADIMYLSMSGTGVGFSVEKYNVNKFPEFSVPLESPTHKFYTIEDSKQGWCDSLIECLIAEFAGNKITFDYSKLRPKGARLMTSGGRSSGPDPLKELHQFIHETIKTRRESGNSRLSTLNVHDIICKIGQIVVAGGVRRSALISISDLDDQEMRDCKNGPIWVNNSQRYLSNNSAAYNVKPSQIQFMKEWIALAESRTGERGIVNRSGLKRVLPKRRVDFLGEKINHVGMNPCVTADTWVQTTSGPRQVHELIGVKTHLYVNGESHLTESEGFFETGTKDVYELKTKKGFTLKLTDNHKILTYEKKNRNSKIIQEWKELKDFKIGEKISFSNHRSGNTWPGTGGTFEEGWLIGQIVGDGGILKSKSDKRNHMGYVRFWGETSKMMADIALEYTKSHVNHRSDLKIVYNKQNKTNQIMCVGLYKLCEKYGITLEKNFTEITERTSSDFQRGLIRGFFDADGSVQGTNKTGYSIRLGQSNLPRLYTIQRMLLRLGIMSIVYENRSPIRKKMMPDGNGGYKEYNLQAQHELIIAKDNICWYMDLIGFHEPAKTKKANDNIKNRITPQKKEYFWDSIKSITKLGMEKVYDVTVSDVHEFCANGIRCHNCSEIILQPFQFCNLTEVVCRSDDTKESLFRKVCIATIMGTIQSSLSDFKYIEDKWKKNQDDERLLGVSLTGIMDCPALNEPGILEYLKNQCIVCNEEYANFLGINTSNSITCVKPSGSVSQMVNSSSGIHPRFAPYYIRRVRISDDDPLLKMMKAQGYQTHRAPEAANTSVLEFPVKSPDNAITVNDTDTIQQLETWKRFKKSWTEHNPSVTIYVKPDEWLETGKWVWDNWDDVLGISFFPKSEHIYEMAPYEAITKEEYESRLKSLKKVNFAELVNFEFEDATEVKKEIACAGGVCEL